jgi:hypothetical protein
MRNNFFLFILSIYAFACQPPAPKPDAWAAFQKCEGGCIKEVLAVKEAFLKNPQQVLTDFQTTYEKGEDHVIGWLFILRDSVLINPKMGTVQERLAMQQALIGAAKPFEKDAKVHEMAKSVIDELGIADVKTGKVNDPMAGQIAQTTPTFCYQFNHQGEHTSCQIMSAANGEFNGYYSWYIEEKDGTEGILRGKNSFFGDTLIMEHKYIQEGETATEELMFLKKGDNLTQLISDDFDKEGRMILKNRKKLKVGNTLLKADCAKVEKTIKSAKDMEKEAYFTHPDPELSPNDEKVYTHLQGKWQSLDDPKAGVKIGEGRFAFTYTGQKTEPSMRFIYYPICPKGCNPMVKMSCLKLIGQDEACYSIEKADGKSLDISQIGGTGNTNRYVKKK